MIKFNFDTSQPGRFSVSRFCLHYSRRNHQTENESSSRVEFVSDILSPTVHLEILNNPPVITMGTVQNRAFYFPSSSSREPWALDPTGLWDFNWNPKWPITWFGELQFRWLKQDAIEKGTPADFLWCAIFLIKSCLSLKMTVQWKLPYGSIRLIESGNRGARFAVGDGLAIFTFTFLRVYSAHYE